MLRRGYGLNDVVWCWHADMGFGHAVVYKTSSSNLSIYIFQGNSPDFPNKKCWVEGHAGIREKKPGCGKC